MNEKRLVDLFDGVYACLTPEQENKYRLACCNSKICLQYKDILDEIGIDGTILGVRPTAAHRARWLANRKKARELLVSILHWTHEWLRNKGLSA